MYLNGHLQNPPGAFTPFFSRQKFLLACRGGLERTGREKPFPATPIPSWYSAKRKPLLFFYQSQSGSSLLAGRGAASTPSQAPRSFCSCSAQCPKYRGGWQGLLEATCVRQRSMKGEHPMLASEAEHAGTPWQRRPFHYYCTRGERAFWQLLRGECEGCICLLSPTSFGWAEGGENLFTGCKEGLMTAADLGMLGIDFPGVPGGGYCVRNGLIVCVCRCCCSFAILQHS